MKAVRCVVAALGLMITFSAAMGQSPPASFDGAKWIWSSLEGDVPLNQFTANVYYFRAEWNVPVDVEVRFAELIITADNLYVIYLNGMSVGESEVDNSSWHKPKRFDVTKLLSAGRNVVAVEAVNTLPGAAGLIAKFVAHGSSGRQIDLVTSGTWKCYAGEQANWYQPDFDDAHWYASRVVGEFGAAPWGSVAARPDRLAAGGPVGKVHEAGRKAVEQAAKQGRVENVVEAPPNADFPWPEAIVFLGDDRSMYLPLQPTSSSLDSLNVTIFNPRKSRAFPEHDLPAPMKVGQKLFQLKPARPGTEPRLLLDAGKGAIGSPSVSADGKWIYVSMAYDGEPFFHIYRLPADGGSPEPLTRGPFHDIDPAELPDGRVVFTSTRIGTFEEYHSPPSRSLFTMHGDGSEIQPLTHTITFDNEPEVLADGRILFIRSDNFFDRGKVETLLHAIHPDGSEGYTEFGLENGPEYGSRLRAYVCGSPAPMPDGRVAFLSRPGITVGRMGHPQKDLHNLRIEAGDVAALPDGRLLCTTPRRVSVELTVGKQTRTVQDLRYEKIGILDPDSRPPRLTVLYESSTGPVHSPVYLGPRVKAPLLSQRREDRGSEEEKATGILFCQNARLTRNLKAGWPHVRAIRVLAGQGLTTRSSHSYIVHAGSDVSELGTVPLAPDGSFCIEVPANTPLALQAVDAEGRSELNQMSWISVRPGERRGCVGCHHTRQAASPHGSALPLAVQAAPLKLLGEGRPLRFRGNNAAVTGMMELQIDRYREVAGINRHSNTEDPLATGRQEVAMLIRQLREGDAGLRTTAAQRLSVFRDPQAASALAEGLEDRDREFRVAAALALATCGTRESVPPLIAALADRDPLVSQAAAIALENLTGHAEPFNPFVASRERHLQAQVWRRWFGGTTWDEIERNLMVRLAGDDGDRVRRAAVALGHTGTEAAHAELRSYLDRERGNNPFPAWRKDGRHRGDAARFSSLDDVNPRTLQAVTRSLGYLHDAGSIPLLVEILAHNRDVETANLFLAEAAVEA
ncbi:MAG: HEAT repeat domain-containing protein, partial [Pirellulaceae bacterium]